MNILCFKSNFTVFTKIDGKFKRGKRCYKKFENVHLYEKYYVCDERRNISNEGCEEYFGGVFYGYY